MRRCAPAPARARPRATWRRCSRRRASRSPSSATRCRTATWSPSASSASPTYADLDRYETTIEEREEYEPHIDAGRVVFAGVDYEAILRAAEAEADVIIWDGGNNDFPFYKPDLSIVVADPLRAGHELRYHPGETNLRMADVVVINKVDSADARADRRRVRADIAARQPARRGRARPGRALTLEGGDIAGKRVLVVEDGPTLTHGGMTYGAGVVAARRFGAAEIVDPRPYAIGASWPTTLAQLPGPRARSCRRWATATRRCTSWSRPSTPCRRTSSSRPRRST